MLIKGTFVLKRRRQLTNNDSSLILTLVHIFSYILTSSGNRVDIYKHFYLSFCKHVCEETQKLIAYGYGETKKIIKNT